MIRSPATLLEQLQANGFKKTRQRAAICAAIERTAGVFTVSDIIAQTKVIDRVSVYRTIERLADIDAIHITTVRDGKVTYERHGGAAGHHHHISCTRCNKTMPVHCALPAITHINGFSHIHHTLALSGICAPCAHRTHV